MDDIEPSPIELLQRVNDLKKVGFTVHVEPSKNGIVFKITKEKPEIKDRNV